MAVGRVLANSACSDRIYENLTGHSGRDWGVRIPGIPLASYAPATEVSRKETINLVFIEAYNKPHMPKNTSIYLKNEVKATIKSLYTVSLLSMVRQCRISGHF